MGIDARCPNGHHVRVKDRFAGRKAYCPECAATFRVPLPDAAALPTAAVVSLDATYAGTLPRATPVGPRRDATRGRERAERPPSGRTARRAAAPAAAPAAERPPASPPHHLHPVIAEAIDLQWYVALPGGEPSEPLSAAVLQEWLDAAGATGAELVWRADWPDWVPIRLVFPEHVPRASG